MNCFMQCCQLCTSDENVSFTIHNLDTDGKCFLDKLEAIVPEIVDCDLKLPNGICTTCAVQLNEADTFIKQCFDSQTILKKHLNKQLCRLCAGSKNISLTLNSIDSDNVSVSYKLETIASEILECNDKLSDSICSTCSVRLNATYNFVEKCFKSHEIFKQHAKEQLQNSEDDKSSRLDSEENNTNFESIYIKEEIIDEEYNNVDLETDRKIKIEESLELENNTNFDIDLENDTKESFKYENSDLHSQLIIKEEHSDVDNETDIISCQASTSTNTKKSRKIAKSHKCAICGKSFISLANLEKHTTLLHTNKKRYACEICNKTFELNGSLQRHIRNHSSERPYECERCGKAFIENVHLQRHIRYHINERPYQCEICPKAFTESGHLKRHMRCHMNERPYKCDVCEKAFTTNDSLKVHIRSHTKEKPYKCKMCDKAYTENRNLQNHIRFHTQKKRYYKCEICTEEFTTPNYLERHTHRFHRKEKL